MLRFAAVALALLGLGGPAMAQPFASRITQVEVKAVEPDKTYGEVDYVKITGTVRGVVDPREAVVGLVARPKNAAGVVEYASNFEIIAPAAYEARNEVVFVEAENRGSAISQGSLGGFLQTHRTSYARVQWQTGIAAGVPADAQGIGLVILRDFGRFLGGKAPGPQITGGFVPPPHGKLILGGISQSAWTVNTLIAEGFNVDPTGQGRGVYDAAVAVDGIGYWLTINQLGQRAGIAQTPYLAPDGAPLARAALLQRPRSDPLYVDIANYTDFYRLRAALTSVDYSGARFRRYDLPTPHAAGQGMSAARCNGGRPVPVNPIRYAPYLRAVVLGVQREIGVASARTERRLPPSTIFRLGPPPPRSEGFNPLPGVATPVPLVDRDAWPVGGVRIPDANYPLGRLLPPAVPPAVTSSIAETCGNSGGFERLSAAEAARRYGSREAYLRRYGASVDRLVRQGFLLAEDRAGMLEAAGRLWPA